MPDVQSENSRLEDEHSCCKHNSSYYKEAIIKFLGRTDLRSIELSAIIDNRE
jgi:hypothetical protein